jgi:hypothetical protein
LSFLPYEEIEDALNETAISYLVEAEENLNVRGSMAPSQSF